MRDIFPNLYRPLAAPSPGNNPSSTYVEATVSRVQSGITSVLDSLAPTSRQGVASTSVVPSNSTGLHSTYMTLPMRRASPYPSFNQRQTYYGYRTQRSSTRSRPSRLPTSNSTSKASGRKFNRTVVLVDSVCDTVPRGRSRTTLHEKGLVVSFVDLYTNWSEEEVHGTIESALNGMIDPSKP